MIYLLGSILLVSYLILALRMLEKLGLNLFQSIVFNYITCVITGSIMSGSFAINNDNIQSNWFPWACLMGSMFIVLFNLTGITAQRISVPVASVAYKLSLIIPVVFSVYLYREKIRVLQWTGIILALIAVILTCLPNKQTEKKNTENKILLFVLPAILFFGSGLLDTLIKYVEQAFLNDTNKDDFLSSAFAATGSIGIIALVIQVARKKQVITWKNILAGICIGIPNYFSIWCMIKFLQFTSLQSSASIPINNMGIVLFSTLAASIFFKEELSKINWLGIALSMIAIMLIAFGDKI